MPFTPLNCLLCMTWPRRLNINPWSEHIPFAFAAIQILKPGVFVELGTNTGQSYCAFCQAVDMLGLDTACYAIDTWRGDEHTGPYSDEVLKDLHSHHDALYGRFSTLIRKTFDEAVGNFPDGSIDFLHIDGLHTYEAVKHDFETWLPKMSTRGVILFHDTNVHERDFGVWRLWSEVKDNYPSFEFKFSAGLGVLGVGKEIPEGIKPLFEAKGEEAAAISKFFQSLGQGNIQRKLLDNKVVQMTKEAKAGLFKKLKKYVKGK